jgi:hypothetical protein
MEEQEPIRDILFEVLDAMRPIKDPAEPPEEGPCFGR